MMGLPKLGASAKRTLRGMMLLKICCPKKVCRSLATWRESVVRSSYMVRRMPSISRFGFKVRRMRISVRSEEHTSELQSHSDLVCRLLLEKKKRKKNENMRIRNYDYR